MEAGGRRPPARGVGKGCSSGLRTHPEGGRPGAEPGRAPRRTPSGGSRFTDGVVGKSVVVEDMVALTPTRIV